MMRTTSAEDGVREPPSFVLQVRRRSGHALRFTLADLSTLDHFHLSPAGQAKIAAAAWNGGWFGGNGPTVAGTAQVGQVLTATAGTWISAPVSTGVVRSWWKCPAGAVCPAGLVQVAGDQPTYTPVAADIGSTIIVKETATTTTTNIPAPTSSSAPTGAVVAAAPPPPPPPPPAPPSGGGGGGGGGSGVADLRLEGSVDPATQPAVGDTLTWRVTVNDYNTGPATGLWVDIQLPMNVSLVSSYADRGTGCTVVGPNKLHCYLDWLADNVQFGHVILVTKVTAVGDHVLTAVTGYSSADPTPADNTLTLQTAPATPAAPKAPTITLANGSTGAATVTRVHGTVLVSTSFTAENAGAVTVSLINTRTGKALSLYARSRVGSSITGREHTAIGSGVGTGPIMVSLRVPPDVFVHPSRYQLRFTASAAGGLSATVTSRVSK